MARLFRVHVQQQSDGHVLVTCHAPICLSRAPTEDEALRRIREEIRYRLEFCPCSAVSEDYVQLEVERDVPR